ncbi:hypothetical protein [Legionella longbeachae]|uniref:Secreted protein n=1 Tax=Legionella longbeachae serogroup 1 (strain NSW150) TaxID=661367 RepID=D3HJG4_LEGLN|nr:hypothetical protein [Legionella longbeachae]VEE03095.1 Uncharacterised protein [Legionella oakridgensis]HBD7399213.1 hypothetical protein [Legionella pneumophila]ARB90685.1 hypothetical protein A6J40_00050 [Legionella longbeachae]ARM32857.1 hypothetical protein B0B39_04705 [Legionella longbeachae]EEZ94335.1 conserved hypothetical protein [Legionella longbeachae D-4968]
MKKIFSLSWILLGSSFILTHGIAIANNPPAYNNITVNCPATSYQQNNTNFITNFGSYIGGYGTASINYATPYQAYFISTGTIQDIPADLTSYTFLTTTYNSTSGTVTCSYQSNVFTSPVFSISYNFTNALGGTVVSQGNNYISINLPFGLVS